MSSGINGQSGTAVGAAPDLSSGTAPNFLFRLDYLLDAPKGKWSRSGHATFDVGIIDPLRTVSTRTDPGSSKALETVGATDKVQPTNVGNSESHERAFTFGGEYALNVVPATPNSGMNMELGIVARGHFDAYFDNQRFFEKDGISYFKLNDPKGFDSGFWRGEIGGRLRITQNASSVNKTGADNVDDLLLIEGFAQWATALNNLSADFNAGHRWMFRFMALPLMPGQSDNKKASKIVLGVEASNDFHHGGKPDVRLIYGINVDIPKLFK